MGHPSKKLAAPRRARWAVRWAKRSRSRPVWAVDRRPGSAVYRRHTALPRGRRRCRPASVPARPADGSLHVLAVADLVGPVGLHLVDPGAAVDRVACLVAREDLVVAALGRNRVLARARGDVVVAAPAAELVRARVAGHPIVAAGTIEEVVP